jgi:hypothetical protein
LDRLEIPSLGIAAGGPCARDCVFALARGLAGRKIIKELNISAEERAISGFRRRGTPPSRPLYFTEILPSAVQPKSIVDNSIPVKSIP